MYKFNFAFFKKKSTVIYSSLDSSGSSEEISRSSVIYLLKTLADNSFHLF